MNQQIPGLDQHLAYILPFFLFFGLVMTVVVTLPYWFIFKKAGFSPWFAVLMLIPLANIILLYVLAFSRWEVIPVRDLQPPGYGGPYPPPYANPLQTPPSSGVPPLPR